LLDEIVPGIDVGSRWPNVVVKAQSSYGRHVIDVSTGNGIFSGDSICTYNRRLCDTYVLFQKRVL
jgi:hypothetical protein